MTVRRPDRAQSPLVTRCPAAKAAGSTAGHRSGRVIRWCAATLAAGVFGLVGAACSRVPSFSASGQPVALPPVGTLQAATDRDLAGMITGLRGRPVIVNLWASWCGPCRVEAPVLERAARYYGDRAVFIGVDAQDQIQPARSFIAAHGVTYPNVVDAGGTITQALGMRGFPTTYVFDGSGRLTAKIFGAISEQTLAGRVRTALTK